MNTQSSRIRAFILSLVAALAIAGCTANPEVEVGGLSSLTNEATSVQAVIAGEMTVFRSPTCGCCAQWIEHVETAGFQVKDQVSEDMNAIKQQYGVPQNLTSCHTAVVGNYIIEGHVPAEDVQRLLVEKPNVAGIAVPGMPIGSPGMESGDYLEPYNVFSFTESGETAVFAEHS